MIKAGAGGPNIGNYFNRPTLRDDLTWYLNAFYALVQYDGIPFSEIDRYATRYGIEDVDEFDLLQAIIQRHLFPAWRQAQDEKMKATAKPSRDEKG